MPTRWRSNTAAIFDPELIGQLADEFGSQCVVVAIDARRRTPGPGWEVFTHGGRQRDGQDAVAWAAQCATLGAGEILVTSMDRDGTRDGFRRRAHANHRRHRRVPVVASGGVGNLEHLVEGATEGGADAVLAASIFHRQEYTVAEAKAYLAAHGVVVRPPAVG